MTVAITGASGFVGRRLADQLRAAGYDVRTLGRKPPHQPSVESLAGCGAVIHLAGEPVAQRWSEKAKQRIRDSRIEGTANLVSLLRRLDRRPHVLVCASAVGYYGHRPGETLVEDSPPGAGFLADVCVEWENAARRAEELGIRVVMVRIGIVLGRDGGALASMLPAFRAGAGGRLGSGRQVMPWIHLDDLCRMFRFAMETPGVTGPLNAAAPHPVPNAGFTRTLAAVLRRPALLPAPEFAVRLIFGEMAQILFWSQHVLPRAAEAAGFRFEFPDLEPALRNLLVRPV